MTGAASGIATGLMIVLKRPNETSPTAPPAVSEVTTASAFTAPSRAVRDGEKWWSTDA
jgi:hypothetical protein